ncbi:MAG: 7-carboxy-7-deazaguanine synthase QueE [Lentimicrobiaceae bacterium]|nr:7-carboxy-7-deazaguanine synthase QueE [Lentimicrobiaceae bacterium]MDG1901478.1 7-carboxy-7-deazaguanine synthase QueE [Bacteroidales bacterium]MDG2082115.1 7-carboxy-7-deazaguanine synthase QueE [Bacteroidales bacterium]|tara:strand:+ start:3725 stop:4354 length:630 start_codon:yes stop_codon:yes gene_type:complete
MAKDSDILKGGKILPIMEEFYTLQGEGYNMGRAAYFVRLGGCDVGCSWCDIKESWNEDLFPPKDVASVILNIKANSADTVVVTGGEPSLYPLDYFTNKLKENDILTMIETSGAHPLSGSWDWICLSPKKYSPPKGNIYERAHELKVIIQHKGDLEWAERNAELVNNDALLFLQPEWSVADDIMPILTEYIMNNPQWRMSLQSHKYMGIP